MSRKLTARRLAAALLAAGSGAAAPAHASLFSGDTLDLVANILAWIVLFAAPLIAIGVFWMVHILPEKIAEKRHHPQAQAIKTLCLLSLFFGGLLWPLAWLWAYSKPVLYKMAYGVDAVKHGEDAAHAPAEPPLAPTLTPTAPELEPTVNDAAAAPQVPPRGARSAVGDRRPWEG
jgi:CBS domain containing-hemolysin-like protein